MSSDKIAIMRMYHGDYLNDNLGHEIINLFATDESEYYIYAPAYGKGNKDVKHAIFVYFHHGTEGTAEVLGYASGITLFDKTKSYSKINYGGKSINQIFDNDQDILITYKAENVKLVKNNVFIQFGAQERRISQKTTSIQKQVGQYLTSYIKNDEEDYAVLINLINNTELWESTSLPKVTKNNLQIPKKTFLEICHKDYNELAYSNALAYFFNKYPEILCQWMETHHMSLTTCKLKIERERRHIDLLIYDDKNVIVIENKILAPLTYINKKKNISQLDVYQQIIEKNINGTLTDKEKKKYAIPELSINMQSHYFILIPNYYDENTLTPFIQTAKYTILKYREIYEICLLLLDIEPYCYDEYFIEFVQTLFKHTKERDDTLFTEMQRRFYNRIYN